MYSFLKERGISREDLINSAMEMYVPHPGLGSREEVEEKLGELLDKALRDPNVNSLMVAAFKLDEVAREGEVPGLEKGAFDRDEVFILADEIIGMAIAEYIAGTRARFEYVRFDMNKPGILSTLQAFADDAIAGLLAGVSSLLYIEALER